MEQIIKKKRFSQERIYHGVLEQKFYFNDLILRKKVQSIPKKQEVQKLFNQIHLLIFSDIQDGQYQIQYKQKPSKDQIIYGSYKANQIRMAESIIKDKLTNLNQQFTLNINDSIDQENVFKFNNYKKFALNSEETKKAQEFIRKLHQQQKIKRQKVKRQRQIQIQQFKKQQQTKREQQQKQKQQKIKQKKIKIQKKQKEKKEIKKQQKRKALEAQIEYGKVAQKTPLYKKKQQDFKKFIIKEHIRKLQIMNELRKNKRSISKDQIDKHIIKYRQLKELLQQQRQQMLRLNEQKNQYQKMYYKGKFFKTIQNQTSLKQINQQKKSKIDQLYNKKVQYATLVKNKFIPKIDPQKTQQIQKIIMDLKPKVKNDKYIAEKVKMQGQRNLQKLHQYLSQLKAKGQIRKNETPSELQLSQRKPSKPRYVNYLNEIKTSRMRNSSIGNHIRFDSLNLSSLQNVNMSHNQIELIQLKAKNLQKLADRKSLYLKNTNNNLDFQDYLTKKFQAQDQYLQSAKAKIHVLNKYQIK